MKSKRPFYKKKKYIIPIIVGFIIIAARIYLPFYVKNYVNKVLADLPGYYGEVKDIDISLYRGAYTIKGLYLNKKDANSQIPFLNFEKTDISIQWKSLFNGKIVSEIEMDSPSVIYVFEDQNKDTATAPEVEDWTQVLTNLVPIDINRFYVANGKLAFVQLAANPNIDLQLNTVELEITNIKNVKRIQQELTSTINGTAKSIGNGNVKLQGKIDILKKIPDLDISFSLEDANAVSLNDLTKHYAGLDFNKGVYSVFSEIAIANGYLKGYIKPILKDVKLLGKEDGFFNGIWEGFVGFFKFVFKNQKKNTLATKVPLQGDLNNIETRIWPALLNILENAWIKSYKESTDNKIDFEDALQPNE